MGTAGALTAAGALVEHDVLPGRVPLNRALRRDGHPGTVPTATAGLLLRGSFVSPARAGKTVKWVIAYPPGTNPERPRTEDNAPLPVCVVLHGRGDDAEDMVNVGYPRFLAAAVGGGAAPFALASVDGGDGYWHQRADGEDPGRMVTDEFLPRLAGYGLGAAPSQRIGFLGWSMGGYGSLLLASQLGRRRVAAVVAESPALWLHAGQTAAGAFDSPADYRAHDVVGAPERLDGIAVRIDCGQADPFLTAAQHFADELRPKPVTSFGAGDHTIGYWRSKAAKAIEFIGNALTSR